MALLAAQLKGARVETFAPVLNRGPIVRLVGRRSEKAAGVSP